jgi:hypothetical protein
LRSFSRRRSQRRMSVVLRLLNEMVFGGDNCRCLVSMCPVSIHDSFSAFSSPHLHPCPGSAYKRTTKRAEYESLRR